MKSGYGVVGKIRVPSTRTATRRTGFIRDTVNKSAFVNIQLPRPTLFGQPGTVTVLPPFLVKRYRENSIRFLLLNEPSSPAVAAPSASTKFVSSPFGLRMLNYAQIITAPTADTPGTVLLFHFDDQRYLFGRIAEGTQRALIERRIAIHKLENVFISGPVGWQNAGGLLGLILTLADVQIQSKEQSELNRASKKNRAVPGQLISAKSASGGVAGLNVHSGKNLSHLLATSRRFVFRKGLPLRPHEVRSDPRIPQGQSTPTSEPDWKDSNINVWYMPVSSQPNDSAVATSPRKRSHDEFRESIATKSSDESSDEHSYEVAGTVVKQMFDSDWSMDALIETTLHQAKLPAKIFERDEKGHIQQYTGPMPDSGEDVPDIPVLIRQPWPGATVEDLPRTEPSKSSLCYIVKGHDRRGRFNPQAAEKLGVEKKDYRFLTNRQSVKGKDGITVTPEMVLGETVVGSGFALVDLPDVSYIDSLVRRPEWTDKKIMTGVRVIYWVLGRGVVGDSRLQKFVKEMSSLEHIVTSPDTCPNMLALESAAAQSYKLRCVDPGRFPLPDHSNEVSLSGAAVGCPPEYAVGRVGKTIQFAPDYIHQDDKIVPFPKINAFPQSQWHGVSKLTAAANKKLNNPDFIKKIEEVEVDIPNRDAEIITLGTGSALPSKYRNVSATLVRVPGLGNYLFDAGENTLAQMRRVFGSELPSVLKDLKVIWISHLHADHHLGTVSVIKAWNEETAVSKPSAKLLVSSHSHMLDWLREYADVEDYGYERLTLSPFARQGLYDRVLRPRGFSTEEIEEFGLTKIEACLVTHCFGALAVVFTFPSGLKVAYSGDCRPSDDFVRIGQGATVLIHESTFDDELRGDAFAKKHSTMSEAIDVGRRMGARRILLTHFSQRYQKVPTMEDDFESRSNARGGKKTDEVILVAFDYMRVELGDFRKAQAYLPAIQRLFEGVEQ